MQLSVAMSVSMWYFTKDKKQIGNHTVFRAIAITTVYHLGTCAFGSLILGKDHPFCHFGSKMYTEYQAQLF
jgi:hypothetical protein